MAYAAYLQENEILVFPWGGAFAHCFKPYRGFLVWTAMAHHGQLLLFQNKTTNAQQMSGGWMGTLGIDWTVRPFARKS